MLYTLQLQVTTPQHTFVDLVFEHWGIAACWIDASAVAFPVGCQVEEMMLN